MHRRSLPRGKAALRRRGRTAVGVMLLAWAATQMGLSLAANLGGPFLRDPSYADKEIRFRQRIAERMDAEGAPFAVAMIGSSRTLMGLNGQLLEEVLAERLGRPAAVTNFGIPAAGPVTNTLNVRRLLRRGPRPDLVLLEVLPPQLACQEPVPREHLFLSAKRLLPDELALVGEFGFPAEETQSQWWWSSAVPGYELRFPMLGRLAHLWLPIHLRSDVGRTADPTATVPNYSMTVSPEDYRRGLARAHGEYFDLLQRMQMGGYPARALRRGLELCREQDVPATLVLMPESTEFRAWYPPAAEAELIAFLHRTANEFGAGLINARDWLGDEAFADGHHQLPSGAADFTRRLGAEVVERGIIRMR